MSRNDCFPAKFKRQIPFACVLIASITAFGFVVLVAQRLYANTPTPDEKKSMSMITGEFEVKIVPADTGDAQIGMMLLDKKYLGDLDATGKGRMLTGMTSTKDSAAYVAIERIEGALKGKRGTFLIQHSGTMSRGKPTLMISVVPDSGTNGLIGLEGTMDIRIEDRKHFYDFRYSLPEVDSKTK